MGQQQYKAPKNVTQLTKKLKRVLIVVEHRDINLKRIKEVNNNLLSYDAINYILFVPPDIKLYIKANDLEMESEQECGIFLANRQRTYMQICTYIL